MTTVERIARPTPVRAPAITSIEGELVAVSGPRKPVRALEHRWLEGGRFAESGIQDLEGLQFERSFTQLDRSSTASTLDRTQRYRELLEEVLSQPPSLGTLDRLVCGEAICMAVIRSTEHHGEDLPWLPSLWPTAQAMHLRVGSVIKSYKVEPSGLATVRIVFTTPVQP